MAEAYDIINRAASDTQGAVTYYIDAAGSDSNDGTDASHPLLTWTGFLTKVKARKIGHPITVQFGVGNFGGLDVSNFNFSPVVTADGASLLIKGTLQDVTPTTGTATGTLTGSATGGTTNGVTMTVLTDSGASWTTNDFKDKFLVMTSGAQSGTILPIIANTDTTITVAANTAIATGTYQIQEAGTVINAVVTQGPGAGSATTAAALAFFANNRGLNRNNALIRVQNFKFSISSGCTNATIEIATDSARIDFTNCQFLSTQAVPQMQIVNPGSVSLTSCAFNNGATNTQQIRGALSTTARTQLGPCLTVTNTYLRGGTSTATIFNSATWAQTSWTQCAVDQTGAGFDLDGGGHVFSLCLINTTLQGIRSRVVNTSVGPTAAQISNCQINSSTGSGLELSGPYFAKCVNLAGTCVTALTVLEGARVKIDAASAINGTTQDILLDESSAKDLDSDMRAASPKLVTNTYGSIVYQ